MKCITSDVADRLNEESGLPKAQRHLTLNCHIQNAFGIETKPNSPK
jgi:hypothetical protein